MRGLIGALDRPPGNLEYVGSVVATAQVGPQSTSWADLSGMTYTFVLGRPRTMFAVFSGAFANASTLANTPYPTYVCWSIDGSTYESNWQSGCRQIGSTLRFCTLTIHRLHDLAEGSHTVKIRWYASYNNAYANSRRLSIFLI